MKNTKYQTLLLITLTICNLLAFADEVDDAEEEKSNFKGNVQLGYLMSSGNTETVNLNGQVHVNYIQDDWLHKLSIEAYSTSDDGITTGERYKFDYQLDKKLEAPSYIFGNTSYEEDRFSGFDYTSTLAAGYGYQLYNEKKTTLSGEIGLGYRKSRVVAEKVVMGESADINEALLRLALNYHWHIGEHRSLSSTLKVDAGEESIITYYEIGFITMINGDLSLKASYVAKYNSEVPTDTKNLDTISSINLLYAF